MSTSRSEVVLGTALVVEVDVGQLQPLGDRQTVGEVALEQIVGRSGRGDLVVGHERVHGGVDGGHLPVREGMRPPLRVQDAFGDDAPPEVDDAVGGDGGALGLGHDGKDNLIPGRDGFGVGVLVDVEVDRLIGGHGVRDGHGIPSIGFAHLLMGELGILYPHFRFGQGSKKHLDKNLNCANV